MIPIRNLLNRIVWDTNFGAASFEIGYYDRMVDTVVRVPFQRIELVPGDHFSFLLHDPQGETYSIPFHRVRKVYRNGELIWHRRD